MRYAKLSKGVPVFSPKRMIIGDNWVYNPTEEQLTELGYLPVVESTPPETDEQHYAVCSWSVINDQIVQNWSIEKIPDIATNEDYENALSDLGVSIND